jgi:hypothetical protein
MKSLLFKVEHGDWSAQLQLPANESLETLAEAIIKAVGFDMDHCYGFYNNLQQYFQSTEEYTLFADIGEECKDGDTGVQGTRIDEVFQPKKKMLFLFDYGDDWMFPVTCTGEAEARPFKRPKILSAAGTPPEQYPDYEE